MSKHVESGVSVGVLDGQVRNGVLIIALLWLMCAFSPARAAQVLYGSLTGNVTDPSNATVPGAHVQALNVQTNVLREDMTNDRGVYLFTALQPGVYKITFSAQAFGTRVVESVRVDANNLVRIYMKLELARQSQRVTITDTPQLLQTDRADVHTDLSSREITDLPLLASNGRIFQSAFRLIPGVGVLGENNSASGKPQRA